MILANKTLLAIASAIFSLQSFAENSVSGKVSILSGQSDFSPYHHDDWKLRADVVLKENFLVRMEHEVSEESEGGFDNNALVYTSNLIQWGYLEQFTDTSELYGTIGYVGVDITHKQKGGIRTGNPASTDFYGTLLSFGFISEPIDNVELELEYSKIDYNTGPSSDVIQFTGNYYIYKNIGLSTNYYNHDLSSGNSISAWKIGLVGKF
jgi:hypothetical protein